MFSTVLSRPGCFLVFPPMYRADVEKDDLKLNIQKTKIMASDPITSFQIEAEKVETVTDFIFLGSKITVDGDCSHEFKRYLLLGRKAMTNLDSILKSRDITLLTKSKLWFSQYLCIDVREQGDQTSQS